MSALPVARDKIDSFGLDAICSAIVDGQLLTHVATQIGVSKASLLEWIEYDSDRSARVREARRLSAAALSELPLENIRAAADPFELAKAREEASHVRWMASKIAPKDYGDKQQVEHSVSDSLAQTILAARKRSGK